MSYCVPPGEGQLLSLHWDPAALLQAGPIGMLYTWNETPLKEGEGGRLSLAYPFPIPSPHV